MRDINCPGCGSFHYRVILDEKIGTRYVKCQECGTIYASPYAPWNTRYAWLNEKFSYGENAINNAASRQKGLMEETKIIKSLKSTGRLLDVGCDLGDFFKCFTPPDWDCYGVELSPSAADYANRTYKVKVQTGTIHDACLPSGYFDVITVLDTFYYIDEPGKDLDEYRRLLKPNGILAIEITGIKYQTLRSLGIICWLIEKRWTRWKSDSSYLNWFSSRGLQKLLLNHGFATTASHIIGSPSTGNSINNMISLVYFKFMNRMPKTSFKTLDWSPKYIYISKLVK